jgi:hypothetical protein
MVKHMIKPCDNHAQDQWASLYLQIARTLVDAYGVDGRGVVREGIREFAARMARDRKNALLEAGCKTNLETFLGEGFGFPCGERCSKEWIRHTEEELFINVISCPYADCWGGENREIGRMFCEEYYPALVHEGTSEKAQINLGYCLLNGRDDSCRLSIYLRPANVPAEKRAECFPAFDLEHPGNAQIPPYTPEYEKQKEYLLHALLHAAESRIGKDCGETVRAAAAACADKQKDSAVLKILEG